MAALDNFRKTKKDINCPECEKQRKHVKMVETEGKGIECPECHYLMRTHR